MFQNVTAFYVDSLTLSLDKETAYHEFLIATPRNDGYLDIHSNLISSNDMATPHRSWSVMSEQAFIQFLRNISTNISFSVCYKDTNNTIINGLPETLQAVVKPAVETA